MPSLVDRVWEDRAAPFRVVRAALAPLAWGFEAAARLRAALYDRGMLPAVRADVPVVSVGNLRVGGTGKTPLVVWLVERLAERGVRAVVVSRGYGGAARAVAISTDAEPLRRGVVADDEVTHVHVSADGSVAGAIDAAADEALLVALRTGRPVVTCPDRLRACRIAQQAFAPDLIVLDDGFQHRRLARDLDVVLVSAADRRARTLPAGPLREPPGALLRADVVIATDGGAGGVSLRRRVVGLVRAPMAAAAVEDPASLAGRRVVAVAGIARPDSFVAGLRDLGADVRETLVFADHHRYTHADWERIARAAVGAERIVTTEKDLVKLGRLSAADGRLSALRIDVDVEGGDALLDLVAARLPRDVAARLRLDASAGRQHHRGPHSRGIGT